MLYQIINEIINKYLQNNIIIETNFNYHVSGKHDIQGYGRPYVSDNRNLINSRETGHFGSGTYFSTYKFDKPNIRKEDDGLNKTPEFIKIKDGLYRVDMDFYKNLYVVNNSYEAKVLYTTLRLLNVMFKNVCEGKYDNAYYYQQIRHNIDYLELNNIDYKSLTRMMQEYKQSDNIQSFSTYFMEQNGYNGVNVSDIADFDTTYHGSVIYDLSNLNIRKVEKKTNKKQMPYSDNHSNQAYNDFVSGDENSKDFSRDFILGTIKFPEQFLSLSENNQIRYIKNCLKNNRPIEYYLLSNALPKIVKFYFKFLYNTYKNDSDQINNIFNNNSNYIRLINKYKLYYFININSNNNYDILHEIFNENYLMNIQDRKSFVNYLLTNFLTKPLNNQDKNKINSFINGEL